LGLYLQSKHKQSTTAKVRKEVIMTKYEMVAKLNMVLNGEYNSADVQSVIDAINEEIRAEANKSLGNAQKNLLKACKNVLKNAEKVGNSKLQGTWIANDKQYVCDGYRIIVNRTPLALKELVLENPNDKPLDVQTLIDKQNFIGEIPLPTLAEIEDAIKKRKAEIKAHKIKYAKILYTIKCHDVYWTYNAEYLRDGILATGATHAKVSERNIYPILMCGADADYFLLPINTSVEREGAYIA
jgi:hypothetical protein